MATVNGMTAEAMQAIADASITGGAVDTNGNLNLSTRAGQTILAGNVMGPITVGLVTLFAGPTAPAGWLLCDGTSVSRTSYAKLFAVVGTTYGVGDGSTTFGLPNLKGRVPVGRDSAQTEFDVLGETGGEKTHLLTTTEMPAHAHVQNAHGHATTETAHNHSQNAHGHTTTEVAHNHTQNSHTHSQSAHGHSITDPGHNHSQDPHTHSEGSHTHSLLYDMIFETGTNRSGFTSGGPNSTSGATVAATPTINSTTASNNSSTTGVSVVSTTATNGSTTPTNNSALTGLDVNSSTATNNSASTGLSVNSTTPTEQNAGGGASHNNIQPYLVMNYIIKY